MDGNGNSRGQAELYNRANDTHIHIEIDCLNVSGNIATMSGTVTQSQSHAAVGSDVWFVVQDNGEGRNANPDRMSPFAVRAAGQGATCDPLAKARRRHP
jgi:hypothetical protein